MAQAFECDRCHELFKYWPKPWSHIRFEWDMKVISKKPGEADPDLCMKCYLVILDRMAKAVQDFIDLSKDQESEN